MAAPNNRSNVQVVARFRPQNSIEDRNGGRTVVTFFPDGQTIEIQGNESNAKFTFDRVFAPGSPQVDVYNFAARNIVEDVMNGYNGTIFAYGQTGSGKTFTMEGPNIEDEATKGVIPRIVEAFFNQIMEADEHIEFTVKVSYFEIYMEKIRDLLNPASINLQVREEPGRGVYVQGCEEVYVGSFEEVMAVMHEGAANRKVAPTGMNLESSRSHSIFVMTVTQVNTTLQSTKSGKLYLVDLAGSERISKTNAEGNTLNEAKTINGSLHTLGQVINALTDGKSKHIPYRDSKLTRVLQESLGGNSRTMLIINCSPSSYNEAETISTLKFGMRAKKIENKAKVNAEASPAEMKLIIAKHEKEIERLNAYIAVLEEQLVALRGGEPISSLNLEGYVAGGGEGGSGSGSAGAMMTPNSKARLPNAAAMQEQLTILQEEKENLLHMHDTIMASLDDKDEELEKLRAALAESNGARKTLRTDYEAATSALSSLQLKFEAAQAELRALEAVVGSGKVPSATTSGGGSGGETGGEASQVAALMSTMAGAESAEVEERERALFLSLKSTSSKMNSMGKALGSDHNTSVDGEEGPALKARLSEIQTKLQAAEAKVSSATSEAESAKSQRAVLEAALADAKVTAEMAATRESSLQRELTSLQTAVDALKAKNDYAEKDLSEATSRAAAKAEEAERLDKELLEAKGRTAKVMQGYEKKKAQLATAVTEKEAAEAAAAAAESKRRALESDKAALEASLAQLQQTLETLTAESASALSQKELAVQAAEATLVETKKSLADVNEEKATLQAALVKAQATVATLERELTETAGLKGSLTDEKTKLLTNITALTSQVEASESRRKTLENDKAILEAKVHALLAAEAASALSLTSEREEAAGKVERATAEIATLRRALGTRDGELAELQSGLSAAAAHVTRLEREVADSAAALAAANEEKTSLSSKVNLLESELANLESRRRAVEAERATLDARVVHLEAAQSAMGNALSENRDAMSSKIEQLAGEVSESRRRLAEKEDEKVELQTSLTRALALQSRAERDLAELVAAKAAVVDEKIKTEEKLTKAEAEVAAGETKRRALTAEVTELEAKLANATATQASLTATLASVREAAAAAADKLNKQVEELLRSEASLTARLEDGSLEAKRLTDELTVTRADYAEVSSARRVLAEEKAAMEKKLAETEGELSLSEGKRKDGESERAALESKVAGLTAQLSSLTAAAAATKASLSTKVDSLTAELSESKRVLTAREEERDGLVANLAKVTASASALESELADVNEAKATLLEEKTSLEGRLTDLTAQVSSLTSVVEGLKTSGRESERVAREEKARADSLVVALKNTQEEAASAAATAATTIGELRESLSQRATEAAAAQRASEAALTEMATAHETAINDLKASMAAAETSQTAKSEDNQLRYMALEHELAAIKAASEEQAHSYVTLKKLLQKDLEDRCMKVVHLQMEMDVQRDEYSRLLTADKKVILKRQKELEKTVQDLGQAQARSAEANGQLEDKVKVLEGKLRAKNDHLQALEEFKDNLQKILAEERDRYEATIEKLRLELDAANAAGGPGGRHTGPAKLIRGGGGRTVTARTPTTPFGPGLARVPSSGGSGSGSGRGGGEGTPTASGFPSEEEDGSGLPASGSASEINHGATSGGGNPSSGDLSEGGGGGGSRLSPVDRELTLGLADAMGGTIPAPVGEPLPSVLDGAEDQPPPATVFGVALPVLRRSSSATRVNAGVAAQAPPPSGATSGGSGDSEPSSSGGGGGDGGTRPGHRRRQSWSEWLGAAVPVVGGSSAAPAAATSSPSPSSQQQQQQHPASPDGRPIVSATPVPAKPRPAATPFSFFGRATATTSTTAGGVSGGSGDGGPSSEPPDPELSGARPIISAGRGGRKQ